MISTIPTKTINMSLDDLCKIEKIKGSDMIL